MDKINMSALDKIGKIGVAENILNKKGKLDSLERTIINSHPLKSWRILENTFEYSAISNIVLCHHEKWDGSGYPKGLKGSEIPIESRIICIADAYDAMTNNRSYRKKTDSVDAVKELQKCAGKQFDPEVVKAFAEHVINTKELNSLSVNLI